MSRAGLLDRRITIETPTFTPDSFGEGVASWATYATVFAQYEAIKGREQIEAQGVEGELEARFRIRYAASVTPTTKMRISYDSKTYGIESVSESGQGRRRLVEMLGRVVNA